MTFKQIIEQVAKELDLPETLVLNTYKSYWKTIKHIIENQDIKSLDNTLITEQQFNDKIVNINIPSIGKLYCTYDSYQGIIHKFNLLNNRREDVKN